MPTPETAKWELVILRDAIEQTTKQLTIAILVANSLGKKEIQKELAEALNHVQWLHP